MMVKEKILLIAQEGLNKGGVQTVIMSLVRSLSWKYQFDIVLFTKEQRYYDQIFLEFGGNIYRIALLKSQSITAKRVEKLFRRIIGRFLIKRIIKKNGPYKAIHCHNSIESDIPLKIAKKSGIRIRVNQIHVVFDDNECSFLKKRLFERRRNIMSALATDSIGCSERACRSFFSNNYSVVLNPFDDRLYKYKPLVDVFFDSPVLIQVGNYSRLKNQLYTLSVFLEVLKQFPNARLNFVGHDDGGYLSTMEAFISLYNISKHVHFYSSDTDIPKVYESSCYCLLPSRTESFGIVLIEAQAIGLRCFVSNSVPPEPNAGGCTYLSIEANPQVWATAIANDFAKTRGRHLPFNVEPYKSNIIANKIDELYSK